jgi:hypothetical protein
VTFSVPRTGDEDLPVTSRVGVTFDEPIDSKSLWRAGAVRLYPTAAGPAGAVVGLVNAQDTIVNFTPEAPLQPATAYTFEIAGGAAEDWSGNAKPVAFSLTFTTAGR